MQWRLITPGAVLVVGCGIPTTIGYIHATEQNQAAYVANERDAEQRQLAEELPRNPPDVAETLAEFIGAGGPTGQAYACLLFSTTAASQLAATLHTTDCPTAIQALHNQVTDPDTYINQITVPTEIWSTTGDNGTLNGCAVTWDRFLVEQPPTPPGPLLGHLTLTRQDGRGWLITGYRGC